MANIITFTRLCVLIILLRVFFLPSTFWIWATFPIGAVVFTLDILDGYVARRFNCSTPFGSMFDVVADRITEMTIWIVLAYLGWMPIWVPIVFIIRGYLVDMIRFEALSNHQSAYEIVRSRLGNFIVKGSFMRTLYGLFKGWTAGWIAIMRIIQHSFPAHWHLWSPTYLLINDIMIYSSVFLCIVRAIPVFTDFFKTQRYLFSNNT